MCHKHLVVSPSYLNLLARPTRIYGGIRCPCSFFLFWFRNKFFGKIGPKLSKMFIKHVFVPICFQCKWEQMGI